MHQRKLPNRDSCETESLLHGSACQKTAAITLRLTVRGRCKNCNQVIYAWLIIVTWDFTLSNPEEALSDGALAASWGL